MSARILLNLLRVLGKSDKMRGLNRILITFHSKFNIFTQGCHGYHNITLLNM